MFGQSDSPLQSHTGAVLANKFMKVLEDFGVVDKVSTSQFNKEEHSLCFFLEDFERDVRQHIHE